MQLLSVDSILVAPNRQRRTFDHSLIVDLAQDIVLNGLHHAVVVRYEGSDPILVAGERRCRAVAILQEMGLSYRFDTQLCSGGLIPTVSKGELSNDLAEEAELSENIQRVDLTWEERATTEARLHALRSRQALSLGQVQTLKQTAEELAGAPVEGGFRGSQLLKSITVARSLEAGDQDVARAKSLEEAFKIVEKKEQVAYRIRLADTLLLSQPASRHSLANAPFDEYLRSLADATIDCLVTDPPYGIGADSFGEQGSRGRSYSDSLEEWFSLMESLIQGLNRVMKPSSHLYVFSSFENFSLLQKLFSTCFFVWPRPLIWNKLGGVLPVPTGGPRYTYECILFAKRGSKEVQVISPDILVYASANRYDHPDEKPMPLYVDLLRRSCLPGDSILDPFVGTGPIYPAANLLQLTAFGCEIDKATFATAYSRMESKQ